MKRFLVVVCAVAVCLSAATAHAQTATPFVQVYFDEYYSVTGLEQCPVEPVSTIYVVGQNFNEWVQSIEYAIEYPAEMTWLGDVIDDAFQLSIGTSPLTGISQGIAVTWTSRGNGFQPLLIQKANVIFSCSPCPDTNIPVVVVQKLTANAWPDGSVRWQRSPDQMDMKAVGMTSYLCATVPVEDTTWGSIKALYDN
jgi:hypothetical protein